MTISTPSAGSAGLQPPRPRDARGGARTVVALGVFDGVHRGHRRVLARLRELGRQHGLATAVATFDPHPRQILHPASAPRLLCSVPDRVALLAATGLVDHCLVLPFDRQRSQEPVEDFVQHTLVAQLGARALVIGENFACGHQRRGTVERLCALGLVHGFDVHAVGLRASFDAHDLPPCSSSETRRLIQQGDLRRAAWMLDRPHELPGIVAAVHAPPCGTEVALPGDLCVPPAGCYQGAVRQPDRPGSGWVPACLEVLREVPDRAPRVRIVGAGAGPAAIGAGLRLRFLSGREAAFRVPAGHIDAAPRTPLPCIA